MTRREVTVVMIAMSMMAGFITGIIIWNTFRGYEVEQPEVTLVAPAVAIETNTPVPTTVPTTVPTAEPTVEVLMVRISHYNPRLLGPNCHPDNVLNGECTSWLSDGNGSWAHWSFYEGWGLACPKTYSLGTKFAITHFPSSSSDGYWTCVDRGSMVVELPGSIRLDLLTPHMPYVRNGTDLIVRDSFSPSGSYQVPAEVVQ